MLEQMFQPPTFYDAPWKWTSGDFSCTNVKPKSKLMDKFRMVFKGEPQKSFIKAGICNMDDSLTSDGRDMFLSYLLQKNGEEFKTEVVDKILAENK